jgi:MscS family membrane protein
MDMHPGKGVLARGGLVFAFAFFWLAGIGHGGLSAAVPIQLGQQPAGISQGANPFRHLAPGGYSAFVGKVNAGRKISDNVSFIGAEIPGLLGDFAGSGAFLSVTWLNLATSVLLLLIVLTLNRIIKSYIHGKVRELLVKRERFAEIATFWDALSKPLSLFVLVYGTFLALAPVLVEIKRVQSLSPVYVVASKAADFAGYIAAFWFIYRLVNVMEAFLRKKALKTETHLDDTLVPLVGRTARIFIAVIGTAIVVKNLTGLDFGPLLASLGIGGMAVAFAAKDSIGNFLGSLTILFDKPFAVGDRIVLDGRDGVVEELGFRSTRIRSMNGSQVSIPNEKIVNTIVENVGRRPSIRWHAVLSIPGKTPPDKVERAVDRIRDILRDHEGMRRSQPPQVHFSGFGENCLTITAMAWYHPSDGSSYEHWLQKTCLEVLRAFEYEGVELLGGKQS